MAKKSTTGLWAAAALCLIVFLTLFSIRQGWLSGFHAQRNPSINEITGLSLPDRDTWMNIMQNDRKIGYVHSVFQNKSDHYTIKEFMFLQVTIMGLTHRIKLDLQAVLNDDLTLRSFDSRLRSGQFNFSAAGRVEDNTLLVTTETEGKSSEMRLPVENTPYLSASLIYAVCNSAMAPNDTMTVSIFDPSSMTIVPVRVTVGKKGSIKIMGMDQAATRLLIDYKGVTQEVWISENGEILKESGMMGLSLEKTDKHIALARVEEGPGDLTEMLAVPANVKFDHPEKLTMLTVKLEGVDLEHLVLTGGRQSLSGRELTIIKESAPGYQGKTEPATDLSEFLQPNPFIQSDDPEIQKLAAQIAPAGTSDRQRAERLMQWVYDNIDKRPVVSMPNALSTLAHRRGDCNEHAMLLAALARAAGIPAQVETGLVYLNGKFFYHAWNRFYVGQWITADATFGQMPADVTHIRLAGGQPEQQLDLIPVIGKISLEITDYRPRL